MFSVRFTGLRVAVSLAAMRELVNEGMTLLDVVEVLEKGYDAPRKRRKGVIERWFDKGRKTYNAVVVRDYDNFMKEDVWVLIHFGKFSKR